MTQILTMQQAEDALAKYIPAVRELLGNDITLERMWPLMEALGNPQDHLHVVHVAGTSGKTSTSYYMAALLRAAGQKVGLTVSPHIDTVRERLQINLEPVSEEQFCASLSEFLNIIAAVRPEPTYFELLVAFAYWYFVKAGVDYAVMETGLGGLHDGTNVARRADKVCIITDIGFDHMHVLGHTLPEIASQKAGIMHKGNDAFMFRQSDEITRVFEDYAREQQAHLHITTEADERHQLGEPPALNELPAYQQRNWLLAHRAFSRLQERDHLAVLAPKQLAESMEAQIPARMNMYHLNNGRTLVMDGAHNLQKMETFVGSLRAKYPQQAAVLLGIKEGKDFDDIIKVLQPVVSRLILTTFAVAQDRRGIGTDPEKLAEAARQHNIPNVSIEPDPIRAFRLLEASPENLLVVTGSLYLVAQLRAGIPDLER